jgi:hypothetical protein
MPEAKDMTPEELRNLADLIERGKLPDEVIQTGQVKVDIYDIDKIIPLVQWKYVGLTDVQEQMPNVLPIITAGSEMSLMKFYDVDDTSYTMWYYPELELKFSTQWGDKYIASSNPV